MTNCSIASKPIKSDVASQHMPDFIDTLYLTTQEPAHIQMAAALLKNGKRVAFRTETVYGLGADACNRDAVAGIYEAKGRPSDNPLIVHVHTVQMARRYAHFDRASLVLANTFWPGPLTLLLPVISPSPLAPAVKAGHRLVGLRIPSTAAARSLIEYSDCAIAAPSANKSGKISPTSADHVKMELDGRIEAILDDGTCEIGVESTIFDTQTLTILREGAITEEQISSCLDQRVTTQSPHLAQNMSAPGQMPSHYAPRSALRLNASLPTSNEMWIGFGATGPQDMWNLSLNGDLEEAARNLYHILRSADQIASSAQKSLSIVPIPAQGIGLAINDRLNRAAAPRPK